MLTIHRAYQLAVYAAKSETEQRAIYAKAAATRDSDEYKEKERLRKRHKVLKDDLNPDLAAWISTLDDEVVLR